jgi:hypothetical protein
MTAGSTRLPGHVDSCHANETKFVYLIEQLHSVIGPAPTRILILQYELQASASFSLDSLRLGRILRAHDDHSSLDAFDLRRDIAFQNSEHSAAFAGTKRFTTIHTVLVLHLLRWRCATRATSTQHSGWCPPRQRSGSGSHSSRSLARSEWASRSTSTSASAAKCWARSRTGFRGGSTDVWKTSRLM